MISRFVRDRRLWGVAACALIAAAGCAAQRPTGLPALASPATEKHRVGEFVWFDLLVDNPDEAKKFYGPLFGWTFEPLDGGDQGYDTIVHRGRPIGGILQHESENDTKPDDIWLASMSVADVDRAVGQAERGGGRVLRQPKRVGERGRVAIVEDLEGAAFALMRTPNGDPAAASEQAGDFHWVQLWARDYEVSIKFYGDVAGWEIGEVLAHDKIDEGFFEANGTEVASVIELPWENVQPNWLPYVGVEDVEQTLTKAEKLGGRVLIRGKHLAILADSQGAAIGIVPLETKSRSDR
ncbi:MAG: VOC family protein [Candidatus Binatia bacterium]|nr:VOC family protein [Candidatus Binatia bacterium]